MLIITGTNIPAILSTNLLIGALELLASSTNLIILEMEVSSPTFAIINEYLGGRLNLYHFDMYRVTGWDDLYSTGFFEYMESGGVLAVEWSENIESALPDDTIKVTIKRLDESTREITIVGSDAK